MAEQELNSKNNNRVITTGHVHLLYSVYRLNKYRKPKHEKHNSLFFC